MALPNRVIALLMDAEEGSEALDALIVDWIAEHLEDDRLRKGPHPPFTNSISATIQLVPPEYGWRCWTDLDSGLGYARLDRVLPSGRSGSPPRRFEWQFQKAHTVPLALCIGALNAVCMGDTPPPAAMSD